jgi:NAD(P)-dependent dehydrogenase (short-subunit alcohol dehydrogenase family)
MCAATRLAGAAASHSAAGNERARGALGDQAALPFLREQGSGHIIQVSSVGGVSAFMNTGAYHASKWALEGFSESLAQEIAGSGIKLTLLEPAGYSTDWSGSSAKHATPLPVYDQIREAAAKVRAQLFTAPGNPEATRDALLTLADSDNPPLRLFLGEAPLHIAVADYGSRLATWAKWQQVAAAAQGTNL